ncbi:MAG: gamma-glutamyltransferase [Deltaproteobacteria bacterium]|nr:gamma-glutamyltransferase [Deltaproteobacteria bacterium]
MQRPIRLPFPLRGVAFAGFLVLLAVGVAVLASPGPMAPRGGAVASATPDATEAGLEILARGGNAADAAIAVALALAVVHPEAGALGGGGFAVVRFDGEVAALDFRETAPARATPDMFLGPDGLPAPERSLVGPLAAGVPGTPSGLAELHRRYGRLPWRETVGPAIRLARDGFSVSERLARALAEDRSLLERFPETAAVWLPGGVPPEPGTRIAIPALARTLAAYADHGASALTRGPAAAAVEAASIAHGGVLSARDLAAYEPQWREPIRFRAFGWDVASMPLPSSGGILLGETVGLLERVGWSTLPEGGADRAGLLVEAWRRAFEDRFLLGDPSTTSADATTLLDPARLDRRASGIDPARATPSEVSTPGLSGERPETTHLSVVDAHGDAVAMTVTLNGRFGCGLLVSELGILLNNEMDDFTAAPGRPNLYGLVQGPANAVGPGKRMLSSMSPTLAWNDEDLVVLGSPGGSRIPTAVVQVLLGVVVDGASLAEAVARPRIHHQWLPDEVAVEPGALAPDVREALDRRGYALVDARAVGEVHAARRHPDGRLEAAADARGPGAAGVWPR